MPPISFSLSALWTTLTALFLRALPSSILGMSLTISFRNPNFSCASTTSLTCLEEIL
ncbi:unnamed protein product [Moneuplotes crassus]|uniref:Uncharacterized protein n=1 Tax=Euplotes crassus TaxID=5936 RepID=A0AAD1Y5Q7_EUPCR|nr:unnamed protein product [Moneuplotes crassus]